MEEMQSRARRFPEPRGYAHRGGSGEGNSGTGKHFPKTFLQPVDRASLPLAADDGLGCVLPAAAGGPSAWPALLHRHGPELHQRFVRARFFMPHDNIRERVTRDRVPYEQWVREGFLTATPGNVVDYEAVRQRLQEWAAEFEVREIAFDPWNATDLVTRLQEQDGFVCVPIRQGFASLSAPTKSLEKAVLSQRLRHDGHPVLRWNMSNIAVETDPTGNIKLSKKVSTERIDGGSALA